MGTTLVPGLGSTLPIANGGTAATTAAGARAALLIPNKNFLIGCMRVSQRGTTFDATPTVPPNNDDTFLLDRWNLLSDGNDIVDVTQDVTVADLMNGSVQVAAACIRLDVEKANKQFGIAQYLEYKDAAAIIGGNVSLSFQAKVSNARIGTIRAAILSWSFTADTITSDFVSAWNAGANITPLAPNWTIEGSAQFSPTTSWATYKLENVAIDTASTANVAVFIWCDDQTNPLAGDFLYITNVQLEKSAVATEFENRPISQEIGLCERYCQFVGRSVQYSAPPFGVCNAAAGKTLVAQHIFPRMRAKPVPTLMGATSDVYAYVYATSTGYAATTISIVATDNMSLLLYYTYITSAVFTVQLPYFIYFNTTTSGILLEAEL